MEGSWLTSLSAGYRRKQLNKAFWNERYYELQTVTTYHHNNTDQNCYISPSRAQEPCFMKLNTFLSCDDPTWWSIPNSQRMQKLSVSYCERNLHNIYPYYCEQLRPLMCHSCKRQTSCNCHFVFDRDLKSNRGLKTLLLYATGNVCSLFSAPFTTSFVH